MSQRRSHRDTGDDQVKVVGREGFIYLNDLNLPVIDLSFLAAARYSSAARVSVASPPSRTGPRWVWMSPEWTTLLGAFLLRMKIYRGKPF